MRFGSSVVSRIAIVVSGAAFGGAVVTTATALTTTPLPSFHQQAPIDIRSASKESPDPPPVRLVIPSLGVSAPVEPLGVTRDYSLEAPRRVSDVGWYRLGPSPGFEGDAVLSGHRGFPGGVPAVFSRLDRIHAGDEIYVRRADGSVARFSVTRVFTIPESRLPAGFFATDGGPRLTLVTCAGDFQTQQLTYTDRLVVEAGPVANKQGAF